MMKTVFTRRISLSTLIASLALAAAVSAAEPVQLITSEEAGLPPTSSTGQGTRNLTRGPGIDPLATPATAVAGRPFRLSVKFMPSNGVPIDPASVRVTYSRQPAVDLTARVKPFVSADGIDAPAVVVPPGRHVIEVQATDKEGRIGRKQFTLTVEVPK